MKLEKINFTTLTTKQKENYNFQKFAAVLADYGYFCMWLNDDWQKADFIALHIDGITTLRVQLKGAGITFCKKYIGKGLYIAFRHEEDYYLYNHDEILSELEYRFSESESWKDEDGEQFWNWKTIPNDLRAYFEEFKINKIHYESN